MGHYLKNYWVFLLSSNQPKPRFDTVIIRLGGEIGIKAAWTRKSYERLLINNLKAVLKHYAIPYQVLNRQFGRLYLKTSEAPNAYQKLTKVFGVSSVSPALETTSRLSEIVDKCVQIGGSELKKHNSFAVSCRRVGKHDYTSQDVCREVGRQVLKAYSKRALRVDLKHPDKTLNVEVREDKAYIFTQVNRGVGGLPLGSQPKVVCLLSADINSLLACWMVMKRGCPITPLHFDEAPFKKGGKDQALHLAETLFEWAIGFPRKVYIVFHGPTLAQFEPNCSEKLRRVLSKRMMYRIAQRIAEMKHAEGIVTGESIEKPVSEALHVLSLQDEAAKPFPIHRPFIGLDTSEIEELARKIGVHDPATQRKKISSAALKKQASISLEEVKRAEEKLNIDELVRKSLETMETLSL